MRVDQVNVGAHCLLPNDVGCRCSHLNARQHGERARAVVHDNGDVVGLGLVGEAVRLRNATHPGGIDHDVVGGALFEDHAVVVWPDHHFADGDGDVGFVAEVGDGVDAVGADDVLHPQHVKWTQRPRNP